MLTMFYEKLRLALKQRGISQAKLSARTKISDGAITRYLNGTRTPTVENLILIAKALNVEYGEIMTWFENGTPNLKKETLREKFLGLFDEMSDFQQETYVDSLEMRLKETKGNSHDKKKNREAKAVRSNS